MEVLLPSRSCDETEVLNTSDRFINIVNKSPETTIKKSKKAVIRPPNPLKKKDYSRRENKRTNGTLGMDRLNESDLF